MPRFTLYRREGAAIDDAAEHLRSAGVRVIASRPGLALVEGSDDQATKLRNLLSGWIITEEVRAAPPRPPHDTPE